MKKIILLFFVFIAGKTFCQTEKPFIHLVDPTKENIKVKTARQFLSGATCKTCSLTINGEPVKVYPTGAFAYEMNLKVGDTSFTLTASNTANATVTKKLDYNYSLPLPPDTVKTLTIASIETYPEGNLYVHAGDKIKFKVKTLPGCTVTANTNIPLYEMPTGTNNKMPGIYQGEYIVKERDSFLVSKFNINVTDKTGKTITQKTTNWVSNFGPLAPNIAVTKGRLAHLLFGLGEDRLGGAKIGYLDSMVQLNIVGKIGTKYKVQLSKYRTAYIDDDAIQFLPKGNFTPESLTNNLRTYGDSLYDYV